VISIGATPTALRPRLRYRASVATLAGLAVFAISACTITRNVGPSASTPAPSTSAINKLAPPPVAYDVAIFLCNAGFQGFADVAPCYARDVTLAEEEAIARALDRDARVAHYVYVSSSTATSSAVSWKGRRLRAP
jgi:hypothetical protein